MCFKKNISFQKFDFACIAGTDWGIRIIENYIYRKDKKKYRS